MRVIDAPPKQKPLPEEFTLMIDDNRFHTHALHHNRVTHKRWHSTRCQRSECDDTMHSAIPDEWKRRRNRHKPNKTTTTWKGGLVPTSSRNEAKTLLLPDSKDSLIPTTRSSAPFSHEQASRRGVAIPRHSF